MQGLDKRASRFNLGRNIRKDVEVYGNLVKKWNDRINLVSRHTLDHLCDRHVMDSLQLWDHIPMTARHLVDLGSGAGFPGMVLAIVARHNRPGLRVTLVESDRRKAAFLRTVSRETGAGVSIVTERIEVADPLAADVLTARALAPLPRLLDFAERHLAPGGLAIFPKGESARHEVDAALANWTFSLQKHPSQSRPDAAILCIGDIARV